MRRWQSHKVVEAEVIHGWVDNTSHSFLWIGERQQAEQIEVPRDFFKRGIPRNGDYLVRYDDGYLSWSPKKAFEEGYALVDDAKTADVASTSRDHSDEAIGEAVAKIRQIVAERLAVLHVPFFAPLEKWEYMLAPLHLFSPDSFNALGDDGWELVGSTVARAPSAQSGSGNMTFIFKRRKHA